LVRQGLHTKVTWEQKSVWAKKVLGGRNSKCQGPEWEQANVLKK
jgi:hypothetical protein